MTSTDQTLADRLDARSRAVLGAISGAAPNEIDLRDRTAASSVDCPAVLGDPGNASELSSACSVCATPVRGRFSGDRRCRACASLIPVPASSVPDELRAGGHSVLAGSTDAITVVLLAGGVRRELVVLDHGRMVSWKSFAQLDQWEWRVVFEACGSRPVEWVDFKQVEAPFDVPEGLRIRDDVVWTARVSSEDRSMQRTLALRGRPCGRQAAMQQIARSLSDPASSPQPCDPASVPDLLGQLRDRRRRTDGTTVTVEVVPHLRRVWLESDGLHRAAGFTDELEQRVAAFVPEAATVVDVPADEVRLAECDGIRAAWLTLGPVQLLQITTDSSTAWHRLDRSGVDPTSVLLGRALTGVRHPLSVAKLTAADRFEGPRVTGGSLVSRSTHLVVCDTDDPGDLGLTSRLAADLDCVSPEAFGASVPEWASRLLPTSARIEPRTVEVGLHVEECWAVRHGRTALFSADGGTVRFDYLVPAGGSRGRLAAFDSGREVDVLVVDRSMHLAEHVLECEYCGTATCAKCDDRVEACVVCGVRRCGRCATLAHPIPICPACSSLEPAGRRAARRKAGRGSSLLIGQDRVHRVELVFPAAAAPTVELFRGQRAASFPLSSTGLGYARAVAGSMGWPDYALSLGDSSV